MIVELLRTTILVTVLVEVNGRPSQLQTTKGKLHRLRRISKHHPITKTTSRGMTLDQVDKHTLQARAKNTYLKNPKFLDKVLRNGLQRRKNSLVGSSEEKNYKLNVDTPSNSALAPRCGVKDSATIGWNKLAKLRNLPMRLRRRFRRYAVQGSKWPISQYTLKWTVSKWSSKMTNAEVKSTLEKAFRAWAEVSPLKFKWEQNAALANIDVKFATGYHGCKQSFDGPRGILAHAYFPQYGGDIHFDDAEPWKPDSTSSNYKSLLKIAIHEIGHSLGLQHSDVSGAIMGRYYLSSLSTRLGDDDIKGIQSIYGRCEPRKIDSIESSFYVGKTYIFRDSLYWKYNDLKNQVQRPDYPRDVPKGWSGLPSKIDEMFQWRYNMRVYFFVGNQYYLFDEYRDKVQSNYPKLISKGWPGVPDNIDAAMSTDDYTSYFFKGDTCYKYDGGLDKVVKVDKISNMWPGVPNDLDSAFVWYYNGFTYFFKGEYYFEWGTSIQHANGPHPIKDKWNNICEV